MNRMWSVLTMPYLVLTVVPSTSGSRSRCTPWRDTSALQLAPAGVQVAQHALELLGHVLHAGRAHDFHGRRGLLQLQLDFRVVQLVLAQLLAKGLACRP